MCRCHHTGFARLLTIVLLLLTAGCGGADDPGLSSIDILPPRLDRVWSTDCIGGYYGETHGAIVSRSFNDANFTANTQIFGTRWCNPGSELSTATATGTFTTGARVRGNLDNAFRVDLTVAQLTLALHAPADIDAANTSTGTSDWVVDQPMTVLSTLGSTCSDDSGCKHAVCAGGSCVTDTATSLTSGWRAVLSAFALPEISAGTVGFDIAKVTSETLQVGSLEVGIATQQAARPVSLADSVFYPQP